MSDFISFIVVELTYSVLSRSHSDNAVWHWHVLCSDEDDDDDEEDTEEEGEEREEENEGEGMSFGEEASCIFGFWTSIASP